MISRVEQVDVREDNRPPVADPEKHAEAIIGTLGLATAIELADLYARQWPASLYWVRLLGAVRDRRDLAAASRFSERAESRTFGIGVGRTSTADRPKQPQGNPASIDIITRREPARGRRP